jgi:hypothetical protein
VIRAMKFWEVVSAFRDEPDILATVFGSDKWRSQYFELFSHFGEFENEQRRDVMDMLLPLELTREIAANCHKKRFWHDPSRQELRAADEGFLLPGRYIEMTALEVHDRFGGSMIEEVCEYGSVQVNDGNYDLSTKIHGRFRDF